MSSTMTVELVTPPPTNNTLDKEERMRLLRSNRKVGAVLGITPFVVEQVSCISSRTVRHDDKRFFHSPSSSMSSEETLMISSEPDYVFVRPTTRSATYQVQAVFDNASPSSSRSTSPFSSYTPACAPVQNRSTVSSAGTNFTSKVNKGNLNGSGSHPSQPLLLRFPAATAVNYNDIDRRIKAEDPLKSPSPVSSTFHISMSVDVLSTSDSGVNALSDREKRRKMAKLARTLGENIPPELVFGGPHVASTSMPPFDSPTPEKRRTSISRPVVSLFDRPTKSPLVKTPKFNASTSLPPLVTVSSPPPVSPPPQDTKRRHRPRSLTLGSSSTFAAVTGGMNQVNVTPSPPTRKTETQTYRPQASPKPFTGVTQESQLLERKKEKPCGHLAAPSFDFGRRKEKEWSGEWNLKDMEDVAKRLRDLKA